MLLKYQSQPCISVAHNIFLTEEQRYELYGGEAVIVTGVSVPVWYNIGKTDEPAEEIFCKYVLKPSLTEAKVEIFENIGYSIYLTKDKMTKKIKNISEGGSECIMFACKSTYNYKNTLYPMLHFVSINDINVLKQSLVSNL